MAETITKKIQIDTNQATANVDKLSKALDDASNNAEELKDNIQDVNSNAKKPIDTAPVEKLSKSMDAAAENAEQLRIQTDNIQKVSAGLQGAFSLAVGAMALFGNESEEVTKIMQKLAAVMVITNGLKAIGEGVAAMIQLRKATEAADAAQKALNLSMIANPYAAVTALIIAMAAAVYMVKKRWDEAADAAGNYQSKIDKTEKAIQSIEKQRDREIERMEAEGKSEEEIFNRRLEYQDQMVEKVMRLKENMERTKRTWAGSDEGLAELETQIEQANERYNELWDERMDMVRSRENEQTKAERIATENERKELEKRNENAREAYEKRLEEERKALQDIADMELEIYASLDEAINSMLDSDLEKWLKHQDRIAQIKSEMMDVEDPFDPDEEAEDFSDQLTNVDKASIAFTKLKKSQQSYMKQFKSDWDEMDMGEQIGFVTDQMNAFGGALNGMFSAIMSGMDENSEAYKGLAITQTIISTLVGMATALSGAFTTKSGPWDIALAAIQAAGILAGGIATISQIASANENTNLGGASASISSSSQVADSAVQGVYGNYSATQSLPSVQGDSAAGQTDNKVYVTATDITMKQKNISNKKTSVKF